jgi:hypothetical protein
MANKHNRPVIKMEYFQSENDDLKSFLSQKGIRLNGWWIAKKTKWWFKEKTEYKAKIVEKALLKNAEKTANSLELPMEQLTIAKKNAVVKVIQKMMWSDLDMTDMERAIRILRTEMWLPNSYAKNENTNIDRIEWIHIVLWWNPIDNWENNKPREI